MKKYLGVFVLALVVLVFSCKKEKELSPECSECGKETGEIEDRRGSVLYDSTFARYYIMMGVPGTFDTFDVGYLCELPEEFQEVGKGVVVSGTLFLTSLAPERSFCCLGRSYCLNLSSIKER